MKARLSLVVSLLVLAALGGATGRRALADTTAGCPVLQAGSGNSVGGTCPTVSGGESNLASDSYSTVGGGFDNQAGDANLSTTTGRYSTVGGGEKNSATHL